MSPLHSLDGYDEVSLTGPTKIITSSMEGVLNPADFGVNLLSQSEIQGDKQLKSLPRCLPTSSLVWNGGPKQCSLCQCGMAIATTTKCTPLEGFQIAKESLLEKD
jgi:anthranilate phosphoribosyltransferase